MFKRILVYLDGARQSERILPYAAEQARTFGSKVVLLRVGSSVPLTVSALGTEQVTIGSSVAVGIAAREELADAKSYLERLSEELSGQGLEVDVAAVMGPVAESIVKFIKENSIDLVAMTARAYSGWKRLFFGSTVEEVLRGCAVPLLVLGAEPAEAATD